MTNITKDQVGVVLAQGGKIEVGKLIYDRLKAIHGPLNGQVICKKHKRGIEVIEQTRIENSDKIDDQKVDL